MPLRRAAVARHSWRVATSLEYEAVERGEECRETQAEQLPVMIVIGQAPFGRRHGVNDAQDMSGQALPKRVTRRFCGEDERSCSHSEVLTQNLPLGPSRMMVNIRVSRHGTDLTVSYE